MFSYGIMQGRLTPSRKRGIQFFPFDNWNQEFYMAKELGLQEIEWIFDYENYEANPLWTKCGCNQILVTIKETDIKVNTICFDYFMRRSFYKFSETEKVSIRNENAVFFKHLLHQMSIIGAKLIEIPLVDESSIKTEKEEQEIIEFISEMAIVAKEQGISIGIESDYKPNIFRSFLDKFSVTNVFANYDSGNSSGLGYDPETEILSLNQCLKNLHIKDRVYGGTTVELGTGSADFDKVFSSLKKIGYKNSIILQAARGEDGKEKENIGKQLLFVKGYVKKYML